MLIEALLIKLAIGLFAGTALVAAVVISFASFQNWIDSNVQKDETVELLKQHLPNAIHIQANIIKKTGWFREEVRLTSSCEGTELSDDLRQRFGRRDKIRIKY